MAINIIILSTLLVSTPKVGSEVVARPSGWLFVSSTEGTITRIDLNTGSSQIIATGLGAVEGLACSVGGRLYAAQTGLIRRIVSMNLDGSGLSLILSFSSTMELVTSGGPEGLSFGPNGDLFFNTDGAAASGFDHTGVWKLPMGSGALVQVILPFAGPGGKGEQTLVLTQGAFKDHLLAVDYSQHRVVRRAPGFDSAMPAVDFITEQYLMTPNGLAVNSVGEIFVSEESSGTVRRFADSGTLIDEYAQTGHGIGKIAFDALDNLYAPTGAGPVIRVLPDLDRTLITVGNVPGGSGVAVCKNPDASLFIVQPGENIPLNVSQYIPSLNMMMTLNLTVALQLRISKLSSSPVDLPSNLSALGVFFEVTVNRTTLLDARIRTFYANSQLEELDENTLAPYTYDPNTGNWVQLEKVASDTNARWVEGTVHHFSLFGVFSEILSKATPALVECSYCTWWLWAGVGGAVVVGTGTAYRMVRRRNGRPVVLDGPLKGGLTQLVAASRTLMPETDGQSEA